MGLTNSKTEDTKDGSYDTTDEGGPIVGRNFGFLRTNDSELEDKTSITYRIEQCRRKYNNDTTSATRLGAKRNLLEVSRPYKVPAGHGSQERISLAFAGGPARPRVFKHQHQPDLQHLGLSNGKFSYGIRNEQDSSTNTYS